jgi:hypothetical protein
LNIRRAALAATILSVGLVIAGCSPVAPPESTPSAAPECPNPHDGGYCLGPLEAGTTYTTELFRPTLTYEVPEGWGNYEDLPGNFLLLPPSGDLNGVDAGTSDYIGIYTSVAALGLSCATTLADTGRTPEEIAAWFKAEPALVVTDGGAVQVGGLSGVVLDLVLAEGGGITCGGMGDTSLVPLILGWAPSSLEHALISGVTMRLYLLAYGDGTLAIEVDDLEGGANLDEYSAIIESMTFES